MNLYPTPDQVHFVQVLCISYLILSLQSLSEVRWLAPLQRSGGRRREREKREKKEAWWKWHASVAPLTEAQLRIEFTLMFPVPAFFITSVGHSLWQQKTVFKSLVLYYIKEELATRSFFRVSTWLTQEISRRKGERGGAQVLESELRALTLWEGIHSMT